LIEPLQQLSLDSEGRDIRKLIKYQKMPYAGPELNFHPMPQSIPLLDLRRAIGLPDPVRPMEYDESKY